MPDLQKILQKIQALRARADCAASSEAEAAMATKVAAELLQKHNINLSELDVKAEGVNKYYWQSDRNSMPLEIGASRGIEKLCNVKIWFEHGGRIVIIGAPADSEIALYYLDLVKWAIKNCWETHRTGEEFLWAQLSAETGRGYAIAFKKGVVSRLSERIGALAVKPETQTTANALVPVKGALVRSWMQEHNINLRSARSTFSSAAGYGAGKEAGNSVSLSKGIERQGRLLIK